MPRLSLELSLGWFSGVGQIPFLAGLEYPQQAPDHTLLLITVVRICLCLALPNFHLKFLKTAILPAEKWAL